MQRAFALTFAVAAALAGWPGRGAAQTAADTAGPLVARTFELRARAGFERPADDGYRRHLDWHAGAGDRWAWYLWEVINGERGGLYVDGTFDHRWADFDAAVTPAEDWANNLVNVEPFVVRSASQAWRLRRDLGSGAASTAMIEGGPLVLRTEYRLRPGGEAAFARAVRQLRTAAGDRPYAVYELVSGGELPTYVVWVPVATWADAGAFADRTAAATGALAEAAERVRAELWRFRPDLSICRTRDAHCYRAVPGGS